MWRFVLAILLSLSTLAWAAEDPRDTYLYRNECPSVGGSFPQDAFGFYRCQCTSYVAHKLNELWGNTSPRFSNQYYSFSQWGDAWKWLDRAQSAQAEIGVTGARDNFVWDETIYNTVFPGDVALWVQKPGYPFGHVAFVEAAGQDSYGKGVAWVDISEYNFVGQGYEFSRRTLYKGDIGFPDYFLHIDKDRIYCRANPTVDSCNTLMSGKIVAAGPGSKYGGLGGFASASSFDLKINRFWSRDALTRLDLISDGSTVRTGQTIEVRNQVKAVNGDTHDFMRPGKNSVEEDFWVQEDDNEWRFLGREYVQAVNLPNGATHTDHVVYTVPAGVSQVRFKVKIDVEDEASESNEGNNWSKVIAFVVDNQPTTDFIVTSIQFTNTPVPVLAGGPMGAKMMLRNIGTTVPPVGIRSSYAIRGPGTNNLWMQIADDGSDPEDLLPGQDHGEEILSLVTAPTVPGQYELRACADYQNAVLEPNEANNCLTTLFTVVPRPAPNLVITLIKDDVGCCTTNTGSRIRPKIWVQNVGSVAPAFSVTVIYHISSPLATGGAYIHIGYGSIRPDELPPGKNDEDGMDGNGWQIPKNSAWKKYWHTVRGCIRTDGGTPVGGGPGEVCDYYGRYSKK